MGSGSNLRQRRHAPKRRNGNSANPASQWRLTCTRWHASTLGVARPEFAKGVVSSGLTRPSTQMIQLTNDPIETTNLVNRVRHPEAGAVVLFLGTTRELTGGK